MRISSRLKVPVTAASPAMVRLQGRVRSEPAFAAGSDLSRPNS